MRFLLLAALLALTPTVASTETAESNCLAQNVYYEAKTTTITDRRAVAAVTVNRTRSKKFPSTVCGVVYQSRQFSWTNKGYAAPRGKEWDIAIRVANDTLSKKVSDPTNGSLYFWNHTVNPPWARRMTVMLRTPHHTYAR